MPALLPVAESPSARPTARSQPVPSSAPASSLAPVPTELSASATRELAAAIEDRKSAIAAKLQSKEINESELLAELAAIKQQTAQFIRQTEANAAAAAARNKSKKPNLKSRTSTRTGSSGASADGRRVRVGPTVDVLNSTAPTRGGAGAGAGSAGAGGIIIVNNRSAAPAIGTSKRVSGGMNTNLSVADTVARYRDEAHSEAAAAAASDELSFTVHDETDATAAAAAVPVASPIRGLSRSAGSSKLQSTAPHRSLAAASAAAYSRTGPVSRPQSTAIPPTIDYARRSPLPTTNELSVSGSVRRPASATGGADESDDLDALLAAINGSGNGSARGSDAQRRSPNSTQSKHSRSAGSVDWDAVNANDSDDGESPAHAASAARDPTGESMVGEQSLEAVEFYYSKHYQPHAGASPNAKSPAPTRTNSRASPSARSQSTSAFGSARPASASATASKAATRRVETATASHARPQSATNTSAADENGDVDPDDAHAAAVAAAASNSNNETDAVTPRSPTSADILASLPPVSDVGVVDAASGVRSTSDRLALLASVLEHCARLNAEAERDRRELSDAEHAWNAAAAQRKLDTAKRSVSIQQSAIPDVIAGLSDTGLLMPAPPPSQAPKQSKPKSAAPPSQSKPKSKSASKRLDPAAIDALSHNELAALIAHNRKLLEWKAPAVVRPPLKLKPASTPVADAAIAHAESTYGSPSPTAKANADRPPFAVPTTTASASSGGAKRSLVAAPPSNRFAVASSAAPSQAFVSTPATFTPAPALSKASLYTGGSSGNGGGAPDRRSSGVPKLNLFGLAN